MHVTFIFEKTKHDIDCMSHSAAIIYKSGNLEFHNTYFGNIKDMKEILINLRNETRKLEDFLFSIEG